MRTQETIGRTRPYGARALEPAPAPGVQPIAVGALGTPDGHARIGRSPRWARISLIGLLVGTAAAYFTNLAASGYGNSFYAAAVEAGSKSWKAMFFGSLDPSNFITVDKPPAALWVMDLSARIFGFHTWSVMGPNVLEGVAAVALLYAAVRRVASPAAGLAAGLMLALTPVAALMFRFDNPDALLTLLLVGAAYALTRALERAQTRWVVLAGSLLGFAFLTKMLQGFAILPALALAYLIAAPTPLRRRLLQLLAGLGAVVLSAGWWVAIVALTPAAERPFIDGSPDNSILNLIFGYNGLSRITGSSGGGASFSGVPGLLRLFNDLLGGQAAWLLPAALIGLVAVLVIRWRAPRTDRVRAAAIIWGGWLLVTGAVFSYGRGIIHTYYTVALAPAIAALVAIGGYELWSRRRHLWAGALGAAATLTTAGIAWMLLDRTPSWHPALRTVVVAAGVLAAGAQAATPLWRGRRRWFWVPVAVATGVACLLGPAAYAADTIATAHAGSIPSAGPATFTAGGFGGAPGALGGGVGSSNAAGLGRAGGGAFPSDGTPPSGSTPGTADRTLPSGRGRGAPAATFGSGAGPTAGRGGFPGGAESGAGAAQGRLGPGGAAGRGLTTSKALTTLLEDGATKYRWVAAVDGSQTAASLELATSGDAVMAIGGFSGQGGRLSLAQFERYVQAGVVHYFVASGGGGLGGGPSSSESAISSWVAAHYTPKTVGGVTVYDLTVAKS
jgi:4-amino-4-deoxy-L-arabinose transferase-like glycosyltransferase